jgi:diphosphomevalonate decarboxylase
MISRVTARAHSNIALAKYWGKLPGQGNNPATGSVSLALDALETVTTIERVNAAEDSVLIDGAPADKKSLTRISDYVDLWRRTGIVHGRFKISSKNSFPTAAGLASSASGFAALATALSGFSVKRLNETKLSRLARIGSGSAARSVIGGIAALSAGRDSAAKKLLTAEQTQWGMVIAVVDAASKKTSSREGMELSRKKSPYYNAWLDQSRKDFRAILAAVRRLDFSAVGEIAEANALAMHACMIATRPSLIYWSGGTVDLIAAAQRMRSEGLETYFTIDAGPNVAFFCRLSDIEHVRRAVAETQLAKSVVLCKPAGPSRIIERV